MKPPAAKEGGPRVAAVDVGSNALRFMAAEPSREGFRSLAAGRVPLRLGREAFSRGELSAETLAEAVRALVAFAVEMDGLAVERRRAVATAALRECRNRAELVRFARRDAGLRLEVISGPEEIRLAHLAVRHRLPSLPEPWLQVELGGGSVEIALADRGGIRWNETHPLGAVRLLEVLGVSGDDPGARAPSWRSTSRRCVCPRGCSPSGRARSWPPAATSRPWPDTGATWRRASARSASAS